MNVEQVELGPRVVERVRAFEVAYDGGCGHNADQWAAVGSLRSCCVGCLRAAGSVAPWERPGPCDACGRLAESTEKSWAVATSVGVIAVLRLCGDCRAEEVLAIGGPGDGEDEMGTRATRLPLTAWLSITAGAAPPQDYSEEDLRTSCCSDCARAWAAARHGGRSTLRLHEDCRQGIGRVAHRSFERSQRTGTHQPRANRLAAVRGVLALAAAEVRP